MTEQILGANAAWDAGTTRKVATKYNTDTLLRPGAAWIRDSQMRTNGLSVKTLNSLTEHLSGTAVAKPRGYDLNRGIQRVVDLAQVICSIELRLITVLAIRLGETSNREEDCWH